MHKEKNSSQPKSLSAGFRIVCVFIHLAGLLGLAVFFLHVVPQFEAMFEAHGGQLPTITQTVLKSSHFLKNYLFFLLPAVCVFLVFDSIILILLYDKISHSIAWGWFLLVFGLELLVLLVAVAALFIPLPVVLKLQE